MALSSTKSSNGRSPNSWEGFGKEFMPPLWMKALILYMPTTMPHASIGEATECSVSLQDRRINAIPEVELAVGKLGRVRESSRSGSDLDD